MLNERRSYSARSSPATLFGQILTPVGSKVHIKHSMLHLRGMRGRLEVLSTVVTSAGVLR